MYLFLNIKKFYSCLTVLVNLSYFPWTLKFVNLISPVKLEFEYSQYYIILYRLTKSIFKKNIINMSIGIFMIA